MAEQQEPYDLNFVFPVREFETDRLKLTPFIPHLHSNAFYTGIVPHPDMFTFIPFPPFVSMDAFNEWIETRIRRDPRMILFAMIDKTTPSSGAQPSEGAVAGIVGLLDTCPQNLTTELGLLFTLPPFQRTHVTTTACALLLKWCFRELQMRRVQWRCDEKNVASVRLAAKLGFKKEVVMRWGRAVRRGPGKIDGYNVHPPRKGDPLGESMPGIHPTVLAICWDDWEDGGWKERITRMLHTSA